MPTPAYNTIFGSLPSKFFLLLKRSVVFRSPVAPFSLLQYRGAIPWPTCPSDGPQQCLSNNACGSILGKWLSTESMRFFLADTRSWEGGCSIAFPFPIPVLLRIDTRNTSVPTLMLGWPCYHTADGPLITPALASPQPLLDHTWLEGIRGGCAGDCVTLPLLPTHATFPVFARIVPSSILRLPLSGWLPASSLNYSSLLTCCFLKNVPTQHPLPIKALYARPHESTEPFSTSIPPNIRTCLFAAPEDT